jgi:hypothetical protein
MWARKNKNRPVSGFFTKITYVQVINFIPGKVSTLYSVEKVWQKYGINSLKIKQNFFQKNLCTGQF